MEQLFQHELLEQLFQQELLEQPSKEIFVPTIIVGAVVPTMIAGTAVPTFIVLTAYYWKSCILVGLNTEKTKNKSVHYMKIYEKVCPKLRPKYIQNMT